MKLTTWFDNWDANADLDRVTERANFANLLRPPKNKSEKRSKERIKKGGFQRARYGQKQKINMENSPCYHFSLKGPKSENLNNSYLWSEMDNFDYDFGFEYLNIKELFKNKKIFQKVA